MVFAKGDELLICSQILFLIEADELCLAFIQAFLCEVKSPCEPRSAPFDASQTLSLRSISTTALKQENYKTSKSRVIFRLLWAFASWIWAFASWKRIRGCQCEWTWTRHPL